jgi:hypothetical protein
MRSRATPSLGLPRSSALALPGRTLLCRAPPSRGLPSHVVLSLILLGRTVDRWRLFDTEMLLDPIEPPVMESHHLIELR